MILRNYLVILTIGFLSSMIPFLLAGIQHGILAIILASIGSWFLIKQNFNNIFFFILNFILAYLAVLIQVFFVYSFYKTENFNSVLYFYSVSSFISVSIYSLLLTLLRTYK